MDNVNLSTHTLLFFELFLHAMLVPLLTNVDGVRLTVHSHCHPGSLLQ